MVLADRKDNNDVSVNVSEISNDEIKIETEHVEVLNDTLKHNLELPDSLKSLSEEEFIAFEKSTRWKLDLKILPMLTLIYIMNTLDRYNLPTARLGGMDEDLNLTQTQFQTAISVFYVGYIIMQVPSNMIVNKTKRPATFITIIMTLWGAISACTAAVQSHNGLIGARFALGWVESGFFSSCLYYLSSWYTRKELTLRNTLLYSGSAVSGSLGGLMSAGIIEGMDGTRGLRSWRWLFIIDGAITVGVVPFAYWILPDMPYNSKGFTEQERDLIMWKLRCEVGQDDTDDIEEDRSYKTAFILAAKDMKVWACIGVLSCIVSASGYTNIFVSILSSLGFPRFKTLCLSVPPHFMSVIASFFWTRHADKTGERFWHITIPLVVTIISFVIMLATTNVGARYFATFLMLPSSMCGYSTTLAWMSNSVPRPPMKRAVALGMMNCLSNSASIWNAYLYLSPPRYTAGWVSNIVLLIAAMVCAYILKRRLIYLNKKIENGTMDWEGDLGKGNDGTEISPDFRFNY